MATDLTGRLVDTAADAIAGAADELTELDQAIGDGDHGINMNRGFAAIAETRETLTAASLPEALQKAGMTLVMKVGGASGPLYGSLLMAMGKAVAEPKTAADVAEMVTAGVDSVKARGKSEAGEKTMLDVLVPVAAALRSGAEQGLGLEELTAKMRRVADEGLESTRDMLATKGRASYLGERSIGHLDPGARSSQILVHAACDCIVQSLSPAEGGSS